MFLILYTSSDESRRNDLPVANCGSLPTLMVPGILGSPDKGDPRVSNEQDRQANIDINEPFVQPSQLNQHILSSAKSVNPSLLRQQSVGFIDPEPPQHRGSYSEHSNLSASQISEITRSMSTHTVKTKVLK